MKDYECEILLNYFERIDARTAKRMFISKMERKLFRKRDDRNPAIRYNAIRYQI